MCEKGCAACGVKKPTHLVQECYRRLQDLLPFAELSLMKLPLKLQDLGPLPSCLRQRTGGRKRGAVQSNRKCVWGRNQLDGTGTIMACQDIAQAIISNECLSHWLGACGRRRSHHVSCCVVMFIHVVIHCCTIVGLKMLR